jgi:hypothetical protein
MGRRFLPLLLLLVVPSIAQAQQAAPPERLLSAGTQVYLRWEGFDAHRQSFDQTAVGQMMKGDTGKFLSAFASYANEQLTALAQQADPQAAPLLAELPKFFQVLGKHGFALGVEVRKVLPPQAQLTLVFPQAAGGDATLPALLKKAAELSQTEVKDIKLGGRTAHQVGQEPVRLVWWVEGKDVVVAIGTEEGEAVLKQAADGPGLAKNDLYRQVSGFKEFPSWAHGFIDLTSIFKVAKEINPGVAQVLGELGLDGVKHVTFHSGFDGPAERGVVQISIPGPRKGLLKLANQRRISLKDLPPMPDDVTSFSASNLNVPAFYEALIDSIESVVKVFAPGEADKVREGLRQVEALIGVKLQDELFGSLGDVVVSYSSPAEGPLGLGRVYLVKVKDGKKLKNALDSVARIFNMIPFVEFQTKTRDYHGAEVVEWHIRAEGNFQVPSYAIYKDWLAISAYPQPVQGFVLRANKEIGVWKPNAELTKRLGQFPKEFTSISVSDPRPTLSTVLSVLPPAVALLNSLSQQFGTGVPPFDVGLIPNAFEATRHLFPNITISTDDGKTIRSETRASLALPF